MQPLNHDLEAQLRQAERRARLYWYEDGIVELLVGTLFLVIGVLFYFEGSAPEDPGRAGISAIGLPLLVIGGVFGVRWLTRRLKEKITYPRTGYVAFRPRPRTGKRRWTTAIVAVGMGMLVSLLLLNAPVSTIWIPTFIGLLVGLFLLIYAYQSSLARFYALALLSVGLGVVGSLTAQNDSLASAVYFGGLGLVLLATGGAVLVRYMHRTRPVEEGS